ncbi:hypothetical protein [Streptomyces sp. NPDC001410]|uniref:hypothetical protein n=1 Tax=Streptomyces sp. NPDC001410 TaxID=3364574 RepID=UPI0036D08D58
MNADWRWEYDPDHDHVADGIPAHVVAEVERLADQLVDLASTGIDVSDLGNGPRPGGLRRVDAERPAGTGVTCPVGVAEAEG